MLDASITVAWLLPDERAPQALQVRVDAPSEPIPRWHRVLALARAHNLTAYDAAYLDLAIQERVPIATLHDDLRAAARRARVSLVGGP